MSHLDSHGLDWEVVVVNNGCTDDTADVVEHHRTHLPVRQVVEPRLGLSHARNAASASARGDLIIWADDDVLVDEEWLQAYAKAAHDFPDSAFFGGPIVPEFEGDPAAWLRQVQSHAGSVWGAIDMGSESVLFVPSRLPFGGNFAVRTAVQLRYPYDAALGRRGHRMLGGEETSVMLRMMADGLNGRWVPNAMLRHFVPRERQTTRHVRSYWQGHTQTQARVQLLESGPLSRFAATQLLTRMILAEIWYRFRRLLTPPKVWIRDLVRVGYLEGHLRGSLPNDDHVERPIVVAVARGLLGPRR